MNVLVVGRRNKMKKTGIDIEVNVDNEKLEKTVDLMQTLSDAVNDTKPNITIRDNENVYVTINNFNETEKQYHED